MDELFIIKTAGTQCTSKVSDPPFLQKHNQLNACLAHKQLSFQSVVSWACHAPLGDELFYQVIHVCKGIITLRVPGILV